MSSYVPSRLETNRFAFQSRTSIVLTGGASWRAGSNPDAQSGRPSAFQPSQQDQHGQDHRALECARAGLASAGKSIGVTLTEQVFVERGDLPPWRRAALRADCLQSACILAWPTAIRDGRKYKLKLATQEVECEIAAIDKVIDASTLAPIARVLNQNLWVGRNEVAEMSIKTKSPVAFDAASEVVPTGRFAIVDGCEISGGGIIIADNYPRRTGDSSHKSEKSSGTVAK